MSLKSESALFLRWGLLTKISQETIKNVKFNYAFLSLWDTTHTLTHTHLCKKWVKRRGSPEGFESMIGRKLLCW